jgi:hypothetical protein
MDYAHCPKFERHELTEDQIIDIAKKAVELAKDDAARDLGRYVITEGKSMVTKVFFWIGAAALALYSWIETHNIKF